MSATATLALFDFDKTIVAGDSFRMFASSGAGGPLGRTVLLVLAALAKGRVISNGRYKELALHRIWDGRGEAERARLVDRQVAALQRRLVDPVADLLRGHLDAGDAVYVLTASPEVYVAPFLAAVAPGAGLRGSTLGERNGITTVDNLYGEAKARVARDLIADAAAAVVHVYTDHAHDLPLMRLADRVTLVNPSGSTLVAAERAGVSYDVLAT